MSAHIHPQSGSGAGMFGPVWSGVPEPPRREEQRRKESAQDVRKIREFYEGVDRYDLEALVRAPVGPFKPMAPSARRGGAPTAVELELEQARFVNLDVHEQEAPHAGSELDRLHLYHSLSEMIVTHHTDPGLRTFHQRSAQEFLELLRGQQLDMDKDPELCVPFSEVEGEQVTQGVGVVRLHVLEEEEGRWRAVNPPPEDVSGDVQEPSAPEDVPPVPRAENMLPPPVPLPQVPYLPTNARPYMSRNAPAFPPNVVPPHPPPPPGAVQPHAAANIQAYFPHPMYAPVNAHPQGVGNAYAFEFGHSQRPMNAPPPFQMPPQPPNNVFGPVPNMMLGQGPAAAFGQVPAHASSQVANHSFSQPSHNAAVNPVGLAPSNAPGQTTGSAFSPGPVNAFGHGPSAAIGHTPQNAASQGPGNAFVQGFGAMPGQGSRSHVPNQGIGNAFGQGSANAPRPVVAQPPTLNAVGSGSTGAADPNFDSMFPGFRDVFDLGPDIDIDSIFAEAVFGSGNGEGNANPSAPASVPGNASAVGSALQNAPGGAFTPYLQEDALAMLQGNAFGHVQGSGNGPAPGFENAPTASGSGSMSTASGSGNAAAPASNNLWGWLRP